MQTVPAYGYSWLKTMSANPWVPQQLTFLKLQTKSILRSMRRLFLSSNKEYVIFSYTQQQFIG